MAFVNTTRIAQDSFGDRAERFLASIRKSLAQRAIFRQTVRELNALSAKELEDLGMHRSMINDLAREAAYGK